ncbi:MAG: hypothetical protein HUJ72_01835 [Blautia sp.]|nr:hypothetical protein [Blautia sp.]
MNRIRKMFVFAACMMAAMCFLTGGSMAKSVQAAEKNGLVKQNGYWYYYEKGVKVVNEPRKVKITKNGVTRKYWCYFNAKGRAVMAKDHSDMGYKKNVTAVKYNGNYYGFDTSGHMVTNGYYNNPDKLKKDGQSYTYYFKSNGKCDLTKTNQIMKYGKYKANAKYIRQILGKPLKEVKFNSCYDQPGTGYYLMYSTIRVSIHRFNNGSEIVFGIFPR